MANDLKDPDSMEIKSPGGKSLMAVGAADVPLDVAIQDQYTDIVDVYVCRELGDVTLASDATVNTRTANLVAGHGFQVGEILCIKNGTWYQGRILVVDGNTITVNQPFNKTYPSGSAGKRTSSDMNVNGSVTPIIFKTYPPSELKWDLTRMLGVIRDNAAMDDGKFGAIATLSNGVMFRIKKSAERYNNLFNARNNSEFAIRAYDATYVDATLGPSGQYGFRFRRSFNGFDKNGVVIRLDGSVGEEFQVIIQDDLTGLTYFSVVAQGHVVVD